MTDPQTNNHQLSLHSNHMQDFEQASSAIIESDQINTISVNNFSYKNLQQGSQNESIILSSHFSELRNEMNFNFMVNKKTDPQQQSSIYPNLQPQTEIQQQQSSEIIATCLQQLAWSLRKIYYRNFFNRLITFYIQSLKEEQRMIKQAKEIEIKQLKEQNWPFKELFYKKYRNPNQQIMFEFINLCASKIQATFKAYIMNKRHKQAITKINIFKQKLKAVLQGWKSSNIYNCKKLKQIRKNFTQISLQIDQEIENPNIDRIKKMKKIGYLQLSQQTLRENFMKSFGYLYENGMWIFQVEKCFKQPTFAYKVKGNNFGMSSNRLTAQTNEVCLKVQNRTTEQTQRDQQQNNQRQQPEKKTRKRQFRGGKNQNKNTTKQLKPQIQQNSQSIASNKQSFSTTTTYQSGGQQRPIMTKGKYEFTEQDIQQTQNEFLKVKSFKQKEQQNVEKNVTNEENSEQPRVNKFKDEEKKRLAKRQKYDPRKAIQEEKKRIEQEKRIKMQKEKQQNNRQKKTQQKQETDPLVKKSTKKQPQVSNKRTPRKQKPQQQQKQQLQPQSVQSPRQSNKQKTLQKIKKESKLTKKGDNSKSIKSININTKKIESKVDCWGPKRQSVIEKSEKGFVGQESSYKSKYLTGLKERNEIKYGVNDNPMASGSIINQKRQKINTYKIKQQQWTPIQQNPHQYQEQQQQPSQSMKQKFSNGYYRQQKQQQRSQNQYQESDQQEEETYQSSYLRKLVEERENVKSSYGNGRSVPGRTKSSEKSMIRREEQRLQQRFQHLSNHIKQRISSSYESHQNTTPITQQKPIQSSQKKAVNQSHRPIESLEQVYCSQYTDRLNNLKNKLNMLESARYIQRDQSLPVLLEDSKYLSKIYKDGVFSTLYWPQVRTMETAFLDYVKLTGF